MSIQQGHPLNDPGVLSDAAWGFGYGNAVIVRYTNDLLPASTRDRLVQAGLSGAHLFVIYAHLSSISVQVQLARRAGADRHDRQHGQFDGDSTCTSKCAPRSTPTTPISAGCASSTRKFCFCAERSTSLLLTPLPQPLSHASGERGVR